MTEPFAALKRGILLVPGGMGTRREVNNTAFLADLKRFAEESVYCLAVCTGSVLLSKAGVLDGKPATSNKKSMAWVKAAAPATDWQNCARWVVSGKYYTASGVSAGMDMALGFIGDRFGREKALSVARGMEYVWNKDPANDPFAC